MPFIKVGRVFERGNKKVVSSFIISVKSLVFCISLLIVPGIYGQDTNSLSSVEIELAAQLNELRAAENNEEKETLNTAFKDELKKALEMEGAFSYPFEQLKTIGFIDSPDKKLRIINWNVEQDDFSHKYYCFVMHYNKKSKEYLVTELIDNSFGMPSKPEDILAANEWYGALYYKIIPVKKGSRMLYTVLGWDYFNSMSQVKLIDVLYVSGTTIKLGNPIFKVGNETKKRVFYEHSKKATMYLNYESDRKRIMMDHLSPESPSMKNFRSYYVPDLSYDAFVYEKKKWVLHEDVIGTNKDSGEKKQAVYVGDKDGKVKKKNIKANWENPEDPNAPAGGSEHVAVTPESAEKSDKNKENTNGEPGTKKKDRRDPSQMSSTLGNKKKRWWQRKK